METVERKRLSRYITHKGKRYERIGAWKYTRDVINYKGGLRVCVNRKWYKTMCASFIKK